ncbi:MAG: PEGA domain-containing protein, partial [Myxococcota bacterium]
MRPTRSRRAVAALIALGLLAALGPFSAAFAQAEGEAAPAPTEETTAEEAPPAEEAAPEPEPEPEPELTQEERTELAREAYGRGVQLFQDELYAEAAAAFDEAYGYVPLPLVLRPLAEAHERAGDVDGAVLALERFLDHDHPDLSDEARAELVAKLAELKTNPGFLDVYVEPEGASITIDGEAREDVAPTRLELPAGEHVVVVDAEGYLPSERMVRVPYGGYARVEIAMEAEPEPEPEPVE